MAMEKEENRGEDDQRPQKRVKIEPVDEASLTYPRQEINSRDPTLERDGNGGLGEHRIKEEEEEIVLAFNDENSISTPRANTTTDSPLPWKNLADNASVSSSLAPHA